LEIIVIGSGPNEDEMLITKDYDLKFRLMAADRILSKEICFFGEDAEENGDGEPEA
jgi:hypothetical protein